MAKTDRVDAAINPLLRAGGHLPDTYQIEDEAQPEGGFTPAASTEGHRTMSAEKDRVEAVIERLRHFVYEPAPVHITNARASAADAVALIRDQQAEIERLYGLAKANNMLARHEGQGRREQVSEAVKLHELIDELRLRAEQAEAEVGRLIEACWVSQQALSGTEADLATAEAQLAAMQAAIVEAVRRAKDDEWDGVCQRDLASIFAPFIKGDADV